MLTLAGRCTSGMLAPASVLLLALIASLDLTYLILRWGDVGQVGGRWWGMEDFRDAVYYPCRAVLEGVNPYDVEVYRE